MDEACIATANTVIPEPIDGELLGEISRELSNLSNMIKADVADDDNIISSDPLVKFDEITETSISSTDSASDSDRSASPDNCVLTAPCDDNNWGPETFTASHGLDQIESVHKVAHVAPNCDVVSLLSEIIEHDNIDQDPVYVVDLTTVMRKVHDWKQLLPRVQPYYAMKCNGDDAICRLLNASGCGFDCASQAEIEAALSYGCPAEKIIYANPCKQASMLRFASQHGVRKMTADNVEELHKIQAIFPTAEIVIRIAVDDSKSVCRFNSKFGAPASEWRSLLATCRTLELEVVGFSFHVGSGCGDVQPFVDAVASARQAFDLAGELGFAPSLLDCGGGFPGHETAGFSFADVAAVLGPAIERHFPAAGGVRVIAEPGRYMVSASHTYAVAVIAKRALTAAHLADAAAIEAFGTAPTAAELAAAAEENKDAVISSADEASKDDNRAHGAAAQSPDVALYINDGVYGSFNCVVFDHVTVEPRVLRAEAGGNLPAVRTKLFGPTCDSIDVVHPCTTLPALSIGDWLWCANMGAYTRCAASRFNGQGVHTVHYIWRGLP